MKRLWWLTVATLAAIQTEEFYTRLTPLRPLQSPQGTMRYVVNSSTLTLPLLFLRGSWQPVLARTIGVQPKSSMHFYHCSFSSIYGTQEQRRKNTRKAKIVKRLKAWLHFKFINDSYFYLKRKTYLWDLLRWEDCVK